MFQIDVISTPEKVVEVVHPREVAVIWVDKEQRQFKLTYYEEAESVTLHQWNSAAWMYGDVISRKQVIPLEVMRRFLEEVDKVE